MMGRVVVGLVLGVVVWCGVVGAAEVVEVAGNPLGDVVIAEEVCSAPGEVGVDAAPVLQAAIERVAERGGGTVFLRSGRYSINTPIIVREGVTLRGEYVKPVSEGTLLCIRGGKGDEEGAAFTLERGAGMIGLTFWYPEQRLSEPVAYPWTVRSADMPANDNQSVMYCTFVNSWRGIGIGPEGNELHTLRNIEMCALRCGIALDSVTDIGRISEVRIAPEVWSGSGLAGAPEGGELRGYLLREDSVGVDIGRSDWEYIWRLRVRGYRRGLVFRQGKRGFTNAVVADSEIVGCGVGVDIEALNQVGLALCGSVIECDGVALALGERLHSVVQAHSCRITGGVEQRSPGVLTLQGCDLSGARVEAVGGQLMAVDCKLGSVKLDGVKRARLLGFDAAKLALEQVGVRGDTMISERWVGGSVEWRGFERRGLRRPRSGEVLMAAEFGVEAESGDNSRALQAALDAAGRVAGGATVYLGPGYYRFRGDLRVPVGVELRGCSDVPHHTVSGGTVLLVEHGGGSEEGEPFMALAGGAGVRGLTVWYPEQPLKSPVPYPWSIRSEGAGCWIRDVTIGNAWQGVDFGSAVNDGHYISYLAGSAYRRGLVVGRSRGGYVEDLQFNPHYAGRLPHKLPRVEGQGGGGVGGRIIEFQRQHLEGVVVRDAVDQVMIGNFLYAAFDGLALYGKSAGTRVLMHGTDTGSRAVTLGLARGGEAELWLTQLVPLGRHVESAIVALPEHRGEARFMATQFWDGPSTAIVGGRGGVVLEQFNSVSGGIRVDSGRCRVVNGVFKREVAEHLAVKQGAVVEVLATHYEQGRLAVGAVERGGRVVQRYNGSSLRPVKVAAAGARVVWESSFEGGGEEVRDTVVKRGGGLRKVAQAECGRLEFGEARSGSVVLRLAGVAEDPSYSFAYMVVSEERVSVMPDSVLRYWHYPVNGLGRATGIDLLFSDGQVLRSSGLQDQHGQGVSPGARKGEVGRWQMIEVPLGRYAGLEVVTVMAAYDSRSGSGGFEAFFDDLSLSSTLDPAALGVRAVPGGGVVAGGSRVEIEGGGEIRVRYTLDGRDPGEGERVYTGPIKLPRSGECELRYTPLNSDGTVSGQVFAELYWCK